MKGYASAINRKKKAQKIEKILEEALGGKINNFTILDIGTGNGEIANYFAAKGNTVYSVDVQKVMFDEDALYEFIEVRDESLPFQSDYFDIIISNHVIEHVRNARKHLTEIKRVLKHRGVCYFASPNRNFPKEPHTQTVLMHYFPYRLFWKLLKVFNKYQEPIMLLSHKKMKKLFKDMGFKFEEYTIKIINNPAKYYMESDLCMRLPGFMSAISPTNVFLLSRQGI